MSRISLARELAHVVPAEDGHDMAECCRLVDAICEYRAQEIKRRKQAAQAQALVDRVGNLEGQVKQMEATIGLVMAMAGGGVS